MALLGEPDMTGMMCASPMMGGGAPSPVTATMTVGAADVPIEILPGIIVTAYFRGYSQSFIGALSPNTFGGATINTLMWTGSGSPTGNGTVQFTVSGNRGAGFVTQITCDGVDLGTIGAPSYDSGSNTTRFSVGGSMLNPFGAFGTKTIVIS